MISFTHNGSRQISYKLTLEQIRRPVLATIQDCGLTLAIIPCNALYFLRYHQLLHPAAGNLKTCSSELLPAMYAPVSVWLTPKTSDKIALSHFQSRLGDSNVNEMDVLIVE